MIGEDIIKEHEIKVELKSQKELVKQLIELRCQLDTAKLLLRHVKCAIEDLNNEYLVGDLFNGIEDFLDG